MLIALKCVEEEQPGEKWQAQFRKAWPYYKKWYISEGLRARPGYLTCLEKLEEHMPELLPVYEKLMPLVGNSDMAARYLSLYSPPAYMTACTQVAWTQQPVSLIRNYDYDLKLFEGLLMKTNWLQPVIGMVDCSWGLLDGFNASGLCVSLTFGGRKISGEGFGIPLVLRYVLETCENVAQAQAVLMRIPVHMSYNVTVMDTTGAFCTLYLSPDRPPYADWSAVATNHQHANEWQEYAAMTATYERKHHVEALLQRPNMDREELIQSFFRPPLYHLNYRKSFVTLYTAVYNLHNSEVQIMWPGKSIRQSFSHFKEQREVISLGKGERSEFRKEGLGW